jgi:formiminoglutamate deiminase
MAVFAKRALLDGHWHGDVRLTFAGSLIETVSIGGRAQSGDTRVDALLPAMANLHSHSFQRAMAGMTERRSAGQDSFWTWRSLMYRFLEHLTPEHVQAIAALAFMEMQKAGYAAVAEFHYLHHAPGGNRYDDPAELSARIFSAAGQTGIGLTHLPVLYTYAGVDRTPLTGGQLRFGNGLDAFADLVARCEAGLADLPPDAHLGVAPHSLRATSPDDLKQLLADRTGGPVHIHIAEQVQEVASVEATLGTRPVDWLLDNAEVNHRWCLIHATHMTAGETGRLAKSGAVAGLCPITEANLGDGFFNGPDFLETGGHYGIGSDSNVRISLTEELRLLEYGQRLSHRARNVLATKGRSTGASLYEAALAGGAQTLDRNCGSIAPGKLADLMALDTRGPHLDGLSDEEILDGFIFAAGDSVITDLWSAGRHMVQAGRHVAEERILANYRIAISDLRGRLTA